LDYTVDVHSLLHATTVGEKTLKGLLDGELAVADLPILTRSAFRRLYSQSRQMLRHIFTLTSIFIFDNNDYTWSGVYGDLTQADAVLFNTCASQAFSKIVRHCIQDGINAHGISKFPTHIGIWAVEKHIHLMIKFRKVAYKWVQALFGLKVGERDANIRRVADALAEGNFV